LHATATIGMLPVFLNDLIIVQDDKKGTNHRVRICSISISPMDKTISIVGREDIYQYGSFAIVGDETTSESMGYGVWRSAGVQYHFF